MNCSICGRESPELKDLPIYVRGSEGIQICCFCYMSLVEYVRGVISACARAKIQIIKDKKGENTT
jgi:hypothetical protein